MSSPHREPWDPGLQVERTTLAWGRTALAFFVGEVHLALALFRETAVAGVACAVLGLLLGAFLTWSIRRRHHLGDDRVRSGGGLPDAKLQAGAVALGILVGCTGLAHLLG